MTTSKKPRKKIWRILGTLVLCLLLALDIVIGVFLFSHSSEAAVDVSLPLYKETYTYAVDEQRCQLRFDSPEGYQISFVNDPDQAFMNVTVGDVQEMLGSKEVSDLGYGTQARPDSDFTVIQNFGTSYAIPYPSDGVVSHYEFQIELDVINSLSRDMLVEAGYYYGNDYSEEILLSYVPFSLIENGTVSWRTKSGGVVNCRISDFPTLISTSYQLYYIDSGNRVPILSNDTYFWNHVYYNGMGIYCTFSFSFEEIPADFAGFEAVALYMGRGSFFFNIGGSFSSDSSYFSFWIPEVTVNCYYYNRSDWENRNEIDNVRDSFGNIASDYIDFEQSIDAAIDNIYNIYGVDPDSLGESFSGLILDIRSHASWGWLSTLWSFFKSYTVLYLFLNTGLVFCMIVFLLRR